MQIAYPGGKILVYEKEKDAQLAERTIYFNLINKRCKDLEFRIDFNSSSVSKEVFKLKEVKETDKIQFFGCNEKKDKTTSDCWCEVIRQKEPKTAYYIIKPKDEELLVNVVIEAEEDVYSYSEDSDLI